MYQLRVLSPGTTLLSQLFQSIGRHVRRTTNDPSGLLKRTSMPVGFLIALVSLLVRQSESSSLHRQLCCWGECCGASTSAQRLLSIRKQRDPDELIFKYNTALLPDDNRLGVNRRSRNGRLKSNLRTPQNSLEYAETLRFG
ncbi:unnamed protein product [Protopolystoma xenopodis]|uniref:Uncharacterized protein n=1 Tax=Protopolystoma xenopodis TaxID=117903 RepID=A0A3S5A290_9PLAT|nr:unnamed protein product [Protopolystoma xenopodis]